MDETDGGMIVPPDETDSHVDPPYADPGEEQLLTRFLAGLVLLGSDELLARLHAVETEFELGATGEFVAQGETMGELLSYLALGIFLRGQRRLSRRIRRGIRLSMETTGWTLGMLNRLTDNPLGRPFRQPVERRFWLLMQEGQRAIGEGRRGAQNARLLAGRTLAQITDDLMAYIIEDPELMALIRRQVVEQSTGLAETATHSARQLGAGADGAVEGVVRRILRRQPRRELPPSPLPADPQVVYSRRPSAGATDDGE